MTQLTPELRERLMLEDAAIERAARALCWDARPVASGRAYDIDSDKWWQMQGPIEQRLYYRRARVCIEAWEQAHA